MSEADPALTSAFERTACTVRELWLRYLALGGNADEVSVEAQVYGLMDLPPGEYNVLAHAVNEALDEVPGAVRGRKVRYLPAGDRGGLRRHSP